MSGRDPAGSPSASADTRDAFQEVVPASNPMYTSEPTAVSAARGASGIAAEQHLQRVLRERGDTIRADGHLADLAAWVASRGDAPEPSSLDPMSRRVGHVGATPWLLFLRGANLSERVIEEQLRKLADSLPRNIPVTRYGIATAGSAEDEMLVIALGSIELSLEPVPKRLSRGQKLSLAGKVDDRFASARLALTRPDGTVRVKKVGRAFKADLPLTVAGVHRIELLGDGATGTVVLANFPVYVDTDEPEPPPRATTDAAAAAKTAAMEAALTPAVAEKQMMNLLRAAREKANVPTLVQDDALAAVARAHADDMAEHRFVGHVSPTTGTPEDRLGRAHLSLPIIGENVAHGSSPEQAHEALMASPGHRANMVRREFTHVGIGAAIRTGFGDQRTLMVTLLFAKRLNPR